MFRNKVFLSLKEINELLEICELHRIVNMFQINRFYYFLINSFKDKSQDTKNSIDYNWNLLLLLNAHLRLAFLDHTNDHFIY